ncbi:olfactory receptor 12D1-like [Podarcis muralis]
MKNQTEVSQFILLGLTDLQGLQPFLFLLFLMLYLISLLGNSIILFAVLTEAHLHTPMYFFLSNLSCLDICYATVTVPKMLAGFISGPQYISFSGCLTQLHFFHFTGSSEGVLLAVMAYDRYVAICNPLRYIVIMNKCTCLLLAAASWGTGFCHALMHTVMTSRLHFCGPNLVQHFFCDIKPLLKLACSSIQLRKAFSTCTSHLTVVHLLYVPVLFNYLPSSGDIPLSDMIATLMYNVGVSVLNPLIYTLRNKEMKLAIRKILVACCCQKLYNSKIPQTIPRTLSKTAIPPPMVVRKEQKGL